MSILMDSDLRALTEAELEAVRGSGGALGIALQTPPLRGVIDWTYTGNRGAVGGSLVLSGGSWSGGVTAGVKLGRATLEGSFNAGPGAWEVQAKVRIPLGGK